MNKYVEKFKKHTDPLKERFGKLTTRERSILILGAISLSCIGLYKIYEPIQSRFTAQTEALHLAEMQAKTVGSMLERYAKLKTRRDAIEKDYREVEFREGELAHLESLIKTKAGVSTGFTIKDNPPKEFGGDYEQTLFTIKFTTTNLPGLIDFLKEVTHGQRPLILSKLDVQRSRFADRLEVDADVSSIKRAAK